MKKYKIPILCYALWLSLVFVNTDHNDSEERIVFGFTIPIILYLLYYLVWVKMMGNQTEPDNNKDKVYCSQCGKEIEADATYCKHCGAKQ